MLLLEPAASGGRMIGGSDKHEAPEQDMQIQIHFGDVTVSPALTGHVEDRIERALKHLPDRRLTRVEVHLHDDKQKRNGPDDTRCTMEARLAGCDPLAVTHKADDLYVAVTGAADKLGRAVKHKVARRDNHSRVAG